jgi:hypothetical protein
MELDPLLVERVYEELSHLHVSLDADPLIYGPKRLNGKVSLIRDMLSRCEALFLQVSQDRHRFQRAHRILSTAIDLAKKRLYDKDPEVRAGRSVSDREAIATGKLASEVMEANRLDLAVQDLDALLVVIRAKRNDLRDTEGRLRDQMRLCSEEIGLGGRWGSQLPDAPEIVPGQGRATGADIKAVSDLLASIDAETHLPPILEETTEEEEVEEEEEEEDAPVQQPVPEVRPSLGRAIERKLAEASTPEPTEEDTPTFEHDAAKASTLFGSGSGSSDMADAFLDNLTSVKDRAGKPRIEPLAEDVLESLFDSF